MKRGGIARWLVGAAARLALLAVVATPIAVGAEPGNGGRAKGDALSTKLGDFTGALAGKANTLYDNLSS